MDAVDTLSTRLQNNAKPALDSQAKENSLKVCSHCGLPCNDPQISEQGFSFCCTGCLAVYNLLNDKNLCYYYTDNKGLTPKESALGELDYLDETATSECFTIFKQGDQVQYRFFIPGMHCNSCIYLLERLDRLHGEVLSSRVDFLSKELLVTTSQSKTTLSTLVALLFRLGYQPDLTLSNNTPKTKSRWSPRVIKIGIAGFCFGNIMMLSFPEYLGLSLDHSSLVLKSWFDAISFLLSLPVLLYCAYEFFENSFKAIRSRTLNIDIPISLAIIATFLRSVYELFIEHQSGYFDSMTGIVFLLLTGRYFQDITHHSLTFDRDYKSYFPLSARRIRNEETEVVNINSLSENDVVELRNAELLPADAILEAGLVTVDYSFITGEAKPVAISEGEKVYAGAVVNGRSARFRLLCSTDNSRLVKLWSLDKNKEDIDDSLTEKINYYFSIGLLLIAAFAMGYQYDLNGTEEAFKALTSVLIVACPCILLLATTFANGHLIRSLKNHGMFVKNKNTLSKLANLDVFVFDKTGTLTDNKQYSVNNSTLLDDEELSGLVYLCRESVHPLSVVISQSYPMGFKHQLNAFQELPGKGIQANVDGRFYRLGSASFIGVQNAQPENGLSMVHIEIDSKYRGYFLFQHHIRQETNELLAELKNQGYQLYLSSGDNVLNSEINSSVFNKTFIRQHPEDKVELIHQLQSEGKVVCMAGDGLNDAPALKESDVAISVADHENSYFPAADVLLTASALKNLPALMKLVKAAKWVIIVCFVFSLVYNCIGLYFAITAQLSPLMAAILMPSSSITMILLTWLMTACLSKVYLKRTSF